MRLFKFNKQNEDDDASLLSAFRESRDPEVLARLYSRYMSLVYGVCLKYLKDREDAKDAVMHLYEHLLTAVEKHEISNFKSWLHVTAKNHCLMKLRRKSVENNSTSISEEFMETVQFVHPTIDEETDPDKDIEQLRKCLETLKKEQRECVEMFYLNKKSYQEIEIMTKYSLKNVKSYIQNGKRNLKICMDQHA